jgi:hypothetical protein
MNSTTNTMGAAGLSLLLAGMLAGCNDTPSGLGTETSTLQQHRGATGKSEQWRPFQANLEAIFFTEFGHPDCPVQPGLVRNTGQGTATHLGRFTAEFNHCAATPELPDFHGELVWTTANGDQIFGTYRGALAPDLPLRSTITGGTGRFLNATGELTQQVTLNFTDFERIAGTVIIRSEGWIAYDASDTRNRP